MTHEQYLLWLAVWNAGIKSGLSTSQSLVNADNAVKEM